MALFYKGQFHGINGHVPSVGWPDPGGRCSCDVSVFQGGLRRRRGGRHRCARPDQHRDFEEEVESFFHTLN